MRLRISAWHDIGAERAVTLDHTVRVSGWLDAGAAYRILYVVEPSWGWAAERRWGDNVGILPGTLTRRPEGECR